MKAVRSYRICLAIIALPMALDKWTPVKVKSGPPPKFSQEGPRWRIQTRNSAGGQLYFYAPPLDPQRGPAFLTWNWSVSKFPATHPNSPFDKANDDYALRVGVLLSDGKEGIRLPFEIESSIGPSAKKVSYVVFYCASHLTKGKRLCGTSPYHDRVANCLLPSEGNSKEIKVSPIEDAVTLFHLSETDTRVLSISGVWVFSDSDNSNSSSEATLGQIRLHSEQEIPTSMKKLGEDNVKK